MLIYWLNPQRAGKLRNSRSRGQQIKTKVQSIKSELFPPMQNWTWGLSTNQTPISHQSVGKHNRSKTESNNKRWTMFIGLFHKKGFDSLCFVFVVLTLCSSFCGMWWEISHKMRQGLFNWKSKSVVGNYSFFLCFKWNILKFKSRKTGSEFLFLSFWKLSSFMLIGTNTECYMKRKHSKDFKCWKNNVLDKRRSESGTL